MDQKPIEQLLKEYKGIECTRTEYEESLTQLAYTKQGTNLTSLKPICSECPEQNQRDKYSIISLKQTLKHLYQTLKPEIPQENCQEKDPFEEKFNILAKEFKILSEKCMEMLRLTEKFLSLRQDSLKIQPDNYEEKVELLQSILTANSSDKLNHEFGVLKKFLQTNLNNNNNSLPDWKSSTNNNRGQKKQILDLYTSKKVQEIEQSQKQLQDILQKTIQSTINQISNFPTDFEQINLPNNIITNRSFEQFKCVSEIPNSHNDIVNCLAIAKDSSFFVSGSEDNSLKLWNFSSKIPLQVFQGHTNYVISVQICDSVKKIVSGSADNSLKIWDLQGNCLQTLQGHSYWVRQIRINKQENKIVSCSSDGTLRLWDFAGTCLKKMSHNNKRICSFDFAKDESQIISGGYEENCFKIWDIQSGVCTKTFPTPFSWIWKLKVHDSKIAICNYDENNVLVYDLGGELVHKLEGHAGGVWDVQFSFGGEYVISGAKDNQVKIWSLENGKCIKSFSQHNNCVWCVQISQDGERIVSGGEDKKICLYSK